MNKKIRNNMNIKSNLDLIERLTVADKCLHKAMDITGRTYGIHNPNHPNIQPGDPKYDMNLPMSSKQANKVNNYLTTVMMAIEDELFQFRSNKSAHYLEFPHQNKKMVKWFGNHHVTGVKRISKKGDDLIIHLDKKRKAVTSFLDVLNDSKFRKIQIEPWSGDSMPKNFKYSGDDKKK